MNKKIKEQGKIYTPNYIVKNILNLSNYNSDNILQKHVIDNSCGDGAFLKEIVERYCKVFLKNNSNIDLLKQDLETYIHGIEIEKEELENCRKNLIDIVSKYGISKIDFDLNCANALSITKYNNSMDFVLGNPPYIRVHNLKSNYNNVKNFLFSQEGMTDAYLVFYELGLKMLSKSGTLAYITPNSLYNSLAAKVFRKHIINNKNLVKVVDLKHFQCFNATTYTTILVLQNQNNKSTIEYSEFNESNLLPKKISTLNYNDIFINNKFYFGTKKYLKEIKKILVYQNTKKYFEVKNGFATLNDKFFIGNFNFEKFVIPIIKASTGKISKCIFPYNENAVPVQYDEIKKQKELHRYFEDNKTILMKRDIDNNNWWLFGRTQAIKDVYKNKIVINSLLRNIEDIKLIFCNKGIGVYSGLYILTDVDFELVKQMLLSQDFINYIKSLSKYKSGGYYTFSSKDLELYLNYKYSIIIGDEEHELFTSY